MTEEGKARKRKQHRIRRRKRYREDAEYRAATHGHRVNWTAAKRKRCPEYAELEKLRSAAYRLREQVERYRAKLAEKEKALMATAKAIVNLAAKCRGV